MRRTVKPFLAFVAAIMLSAAAAADFPEGRQGWLILESNRTGAREVVTVLQNLPDPDFRARFPVLLRVIWGYASLADGMPTEEEIVRGRELYSNLDRILGQGGVYAMSRTGSGGRTMYYYVDDVVAKSTAMQSYFDSLSPISVKLIARKEQEWDSVKEVLDGIK